MQEINFKIVDTDIYPDIDSGFTILSPVPYLIKWDITYAEIAKNEDISISQSKYGQEIITFNYPAQIGNIILEGLSILSNNENPDTPVMQLYTNMYDKSNTDKSYYALKAALTKMFGQSGNFYERSDQNYFSIENKKIIFSIIYTYNSEFAAESGYTSFIIQNSREYPHLYKNEDYEKKVSIDDYIQFTNGVNLSSHYKINKRIKKGTYTIRKLFGKRAGMWIDDTNNLIGFYDGKSTMVFDKNEIQAISFLNILPAKGSGGSYVKVILTDGMEQEVLNGIVNTFDPFIEKIKLVTGKAIIIEPESYDC